MRHYSPSPTVRSSVIPFYMQGFPGRHHLGQDDGGILFSDVTPIDTTMYDPGNDLVAPPSFALPVDPVPSSLLPSIPGVTPIDTTMYDPSTGLIAPVSVSPQTASLAQLYKSAAASGAITPAQADSAIAQLFTASTVAAKGLATAPSPRVAVPVPGAAPSLMTSLTQSTVIPGIPNLALIAIAAAAVLAMGKR